MTVVSERAVQATERRARARATPAAAAPGTPPRRLAAAVVVTLLAAQLSWLGLLVYVLVAYVV